MHVLLIIIAVVAIFVLSVFAFMRSAQFGGKAAGARLQRVGRSPNYKDGAFRNLSDTPQLTDGATMLSVMRSFFFGDKKNRVPPATLPTRKTDLRGLAQDRVLVWFGHSSYFMRIGGRNYLVDPVFSGNAAPLAGSNKAFKGTDVYTAEDMPEIDYLVITHDHWDHLDYPTVKQLRPKVRRVITTLGVGAHLERWGYEPGIITEGDWGDELRLEEGVVMNVTPARHFSGRGFKRNGTLWASFVLATPQMKVYIGADSGYDTHFAAIGAKYGPIDLAILEDGQYNKSWKYIHMLPEEVVQAATDLKAKILLPVHWGKFALSLHDWDEPIKRVVKEAADSYRQSGVQVVHPMIGEALDMKNAGEQERWWEDLTPALSTGGEGGVA